MADLPVFLLALAPGADPGAWMERFRDHLPDYEVLSPQDEPAVERVRYAACWKHDHGVLTPFQHTDIIFSLGAGVDHLLADPTLPKAASIVRVVDPDLTNRMSEWVLLHTLIHHRQQRMYDYQQFEKIWAEDEDQPAAKDVRVGVMGMGVLGVDAARKLQMVGFDVAGWSRTPKTVEGVETFSGEAGLPAFLARTHILVCLLPLTPATRGILCMSLFRQLARDSHLGGPIILNAGRGGLQVEADIVQALEQGVLRHATLDVFETEPLPRESGLWHHPGITITPHSAALSHPAAVAAYIAGQIRDHEKGGTLANIVRREAGY